MPEPILTLRSVDLEWRSIEGEIVVLDLKRSEYIGVNATGAAVWRALAAGASRNALLDLVLEGFEVSREQAAEDLQAFLESLEARELLDHR